MSSSLEAQHNLWKNAKVMSFLFVLASTQLQAFGHILEYQPYLSIPRNVYSREAAKGFTTGVVSPSWRAPERSRSLMVVTVTTWFGWSMFTDSVRDVTKCSSSSASSRDTRHPALQSAPLFTRYACLFLQCHTERWTQPLQAGLSDGGA